jgi:hypothetical protein
MMRRVAQVVLTTAALVRIVDFLMEHWAQFVAWFS